jgi:hypothetical protein
MLREFELATVSISGMNHGVSVSGRTSAARIHVDIGIDIDIIDIAILHARHGV